MIFVRRLVDRLAPPAGQPQTSAELYPFDRRLEVLPLVPDCTGIVLDVGCGRGGFGHALRTHNRARCIWGLEQNESLRTTAAPHYDSLIVGTFPEALQGCGYLFDCIVFNDVLEHMVDPWSALGCAQAYLTPDGSVVASIPNVRNARTVFGLAIRGDWTYVDMGVLDRTHLRFFTKSTICDLFNKAGYDVEEVRGINSIGQSRRGLGRGLRLLFGEMAFTGFAVRARPSRSAEGEPGLTAVTC